MDEAFHVFMIVWKWKIETESAVIESLLCGEPWYYIFSPQVFFRTETLTAQRCLSSTFSKNISLLNNYFHTSAALIWLNIYLIQIESECRFAQLKKITCKNLEYDKRVKEVFLVPDFHVVGLGWEMESSNSSLQLSCMSEPGRTKKIYLVKYMDKDLSAWLYSRRIIKNGITETFNSLNRFFWPFLKITVQ